MKTIDGHVHIFAPEIIEKRDEIAEKDPGFAVIYQDRRSKMADLDGLIQYMSACELEGCVVCGFPFKDRGLLSLENDYLLETLVSHPTTFPLVAIDIGDEQAALAELERCLKRGAAGAGEIAFYDRTLGTRELRSLDEVARLLASSNAALMLHVNEQVGHPYKGKITIDLLEIVKFVERHRDLRIVLAHLGGGLCFYEFMPEIKETFSRVFYDTAASPLLYSNEVYRFIDLFLSEKTVFGSDFPLLSYPRYKEDLLGLVGGRREMVLCSNARRAFDRA